MYHIRTEYRVLVKEVSDFSAELKQLNLRRVITYILFYMFKFFSSQKGGEKLHGPRDENAELPTDDSVFLFSVDEDFDLMDLGFDAHFI